MTKSKKNKTKKNDYKVKLSKLRRKNKQTMLVVKNCFSSNAGIKYPSAIQFGECHQLKLSQLVVVVVVAAAPAVFVVVIIAAVVVDIVVFIVVVAVGVELVNVVIPVFGVVVVVVVVVLDVVVIITFVVFVIDVDVIITVFIIVVVVVIVVAPLLKQILDCSPVGLLTSLKMLERSPSIQSLETTSRIP